MKQLLFLFLFSTVISIQAQQNSFSKEALDDIFFTEDNTIITLSEILEIYKGKTIVIDVWAGWCKDCVEGLPKVKKLQKEHKDVVFLFLSLDKTVASWKKAIEVFNIEGEHYLNKIGWKSDFSKSVKLDWIPRYMIVNPEGKITLFKAIKADDERIVNALND
jgi:thiol-disulfide isomerase/thioredoxin